MADLLPLPPELAAPEPDLDDAVVDLAAFAVQDATDSGIDPADAGASLALEPALAPTLPAPLRGWRITGPGSAEWAMRHVARCSAELDALREQADEWADRISWWFTQAAAPLEATRAFMDAHLRQYALDVRAADPTKKTVTLPSGSVPTRSSPPAVQIVDPDAALAWARPFAHLGLISTTERVLVSTLRDHVTVVEVIDLARLTFSDGEIVLWSRDGRPVAAEIDPEARGVTSAKCPGVGDGWPTPEAAEVLVGQREVLAAHLEVLGPDGVPVPANVATVTDGSVTASVKVGP